MQNVGEGVDHPGWAGHRSVDGQMIGHALHTEHSLHIDSPLFAEGLKPGHLLFLVEGLEEVPDRDNPDDLPFFGDP